MVQDTGNRLITAFQKQTEKINYFCSAENISPNLAVHEIRKSFKRIRALLRFYSECKEVQSSEIIIEIKAVGKLLSPIRESFVNIQIFDRFIVGDNHISERKIKQARYVLTEKNKFSIENDYLKNNLCSVILEFVQHFGVLTQTFSPDRPSIMQMKDQLALGFAESFEIFKQLETEYSAENIHELRKSLKSLWYQLDFIKFMHPRYFRMKSDQLNKITEQLGDDHDLFVFKEELKHLEYEFTKEELTILENQVEHQRELNMLKLSPRLKQFFNEPPEIFNRKLEKIFRIL